MAGMAPLFEGGSSYPQETNFPFSIFLSKKVLLCSVFCSYVLDQGYVHGNARIGEIFKIVSQ